VTGRCGGDRATTSSSSPIDGRVTRPRGRAAMRGKRGNSTKVGLIDGRGGSGVAAAVGDVFLAAMRDRVGGSRTAAANDGSTALRYAAIGVDT